MPTPATDIDPTVALATAIDAYLTGQRTLFDVLQPLATVIRNLQSSVSIINSTVQGNTLSIVQLQAQLTALLTVGGGSGGGTNGLVPVVTGGYKTTDAATYGRLWGPGRHLCDSLGNLVCGTVSSLQQVAAGSFRTPKAGPLAEVRVYLPSGSGYAGGNGGVVQVDIYPIDANGEALTTNNPLASGSLTLGWTAGAPATPAGQFVTVPLGAPGGGGSFTNARVAPVGDSLANGGLPAGGINEPDSVSYRGPLYQSINISGRTISFIGVDQNPTRDDLEPTGNKAAQGGAQLIYGTGDGAGVKSARQKLDDLKAAYPSGPYTDLIVVLNGGANDFGARGQSPTQVRDDWLTLAAYQQTVFPSSKCILLGVIATNGWITPEQYGPTDTALAALAASNSNFKFVNTHTLGLAGTGSSGDFQDDETHLTKQGSVKLGAAIGAVANSTLFSGGAATPLLADTVYRCVFKNTAAVPATNFFSINNQLTLLKNGYGDRWAMLNDWASSFGRRTVGSADPYTWTSRTTQPSATDPAYYYPVCQFKYADGTVFGNSNMETGNVNSGSPARTFAVTAALPVRERINPLKDKYILGLSVNTAMSTAGGSLKVQLLQGITEVMPAQYITEAVANFSTDVINSNDIGVYKWYDLPFSSDGSVSYKLTAGVTYDLVFTPQGASVWKFADQLNGASYSYVSPAAFTEGVAQNYYGGAWIRANHYDHTTDRGANDVNWRWVFHTTASATTPPADPITDPTFIQRVIDNMAVASDGPGYALPMLGVSLGDSAKTQRGGLTQIRLFNDGIVSWGYQYPAGTLWKYIWPWIVVYPGQGHVDNALWYISFEQMDMQYFWIPDQKWHRVSGYPCPPAGLDWWDGYGGAFNPGFEAAGPATNQTRYSMPAPGTLNTPNPWMHQGVGPGLDIPVPGSTVVDGSDIYAWHVAVTTKYVPRTGSVLNTSGASLYVQVGADSKTNASNSQNDQGINGNYSGGRIVPTDGTKKRLYMTTFTNPPSHTLVNGTPANPARINDAPTETWLREHPPLSDLEP